MLKISVITVCHNAVETIHDSIASVAAQKLPTGVEVEHRIIDGASTDGTVQLLARLGDEFRFEWTSEADDGLYFAMNKGIGMASGEIVGILNADDWYSSDRVLAEVVAALEDRSADACYADLQYVSQSDPAKVVRDWRAGEFVPGAFFRGWMLPHPTFFARREVYEKSGSFDTRYRLGADWELLFRLFEIEKISAVYVPRQWVTMRLGGATNRSLRNIVANHRECLDAFRKHGCSAAWLFSLRKVCHRLAQFLPR